MKLFSILLAALLLAVPIVAVDVSASGSAAMTCTPNASCAAECVKNQEPLCADSPAYQQCLAFYGQDKVVNPSWIFTRRCALGVQCRMSPQIAADYLNGCKNACPSTCVASASASGTTHPVLPNVPGPNANSACFRSCGEFSSWMLEGGVPKPVWFNLAVGQSIKTTDLHSDCSGLIFKSWMGGAFSSTTDTFVAGQAYLATSSKACTIMYNVKCA